MKQLLVMGVALTLLGGCSQSDQNSSVESILPENTETVVLHVKEMS